MRSRVSITRSKGRTRLLRSASRSSATLLAENSTACSAGDVEAAAVLRAWLWALPRPPARERAAALRARRRPGLGLRAGCDLARVPEDFFAREAPPDFAARAAARPARRSSSSWTTWRATRPISSATLRTSSRPTSSHRTSRRSTSTRLTCAVRLDPEPCLFSLAGNPLRAGTISCRTTRRRQGGRTGAGAAPSGRAPRAVRAGGRAGASTGSAPRASTWSIDPGHRGAQPVAALQLAVELRVLLGPDVESRRPAAGAGDPPSRQRSPPRGPRRGRRRVGRGWRAGSPPTALRRPGPAARTRRSTRRSGRRVRTWRETSTARHGARSSTWFDPPSFEAIRSGLSSAAAARSGASELREVSASAPAARAARPSGREPARRRLLEQRDVPLHLRQDPRELG